TKEVWRDKDGKALHPHTNYNVGGNTKFYGAALFRLRKEDFGELRHAGGLSPAWPLSYEDLEPYYTRAEQLYDVHRERALPPPGDQPRAAHPAAPRRPGELGLPALPRPARRQAGRARSAQKHM